MSYAVVAPIVALLTFAAIVGGTLHLLAAHRRIVSRSRGPAEKPGDPVNDSGEGAETSDEAAAPRPPGPPSAS